MFNRLFNLIKRLFSDNREQPQQEETPGDLFEPRDRMIYKYFDGQQLNRVDPIVLWMKVEEALPEISISIKISNSPSKGAAKAHKDLIHKIQEVFGLKPFDQGGLTEAECVGLLNHFMDYTNAIKKKANRTATSPGETSPSTASSSEGSQPTPNSSDSSSTASVPPTSVPSPSPTA